MPPLAQKTAGKPKEKANAVVLRRARSPSKTSQNVRSSPHGAAVNGELITSALKTEKGVPVDYFMPVKEMVRPANQLQLSEADLGVEIACMLTSAKPGAPSNVATFHLRERTFKTEPFSDHLLRLYSSEGCLAYREIPSIEQASQPARSESVTEDAGMGPEPPSTSAGDVPLHNQFNYNDRAAQTPAHPPAEAGTMTQPPPTADAGGSCSPWHMHDAYMADLERQKAAEEAAKVRSAAARKRADTAAENEEEVDAAAQDGSQMGLTSESLQSLVHMLERMMNQNSHHDVIMDFKYWDDPADGIRQHEGTLLPLWKFQAEAGRGRHVTSLCWSPAYADLFAVGFGSFDAQRQGTGAVVCFSLKDPKRPEYHFTTRSGVMCLHFHPQHANMLAVGLHDGTVLVLDVSKPAAAAALYEAAAAGSKHLDTVAAVRWAPGEGSGLRGLAFYSVSADGHIVHWTLAKSTLVRQDFMRLHSRAGNAEDEVMGCAFAGGTCLDFHTEQEHLFIVGSEEGALQKCSKTYNSQYLATYDGHVGAVYSVQWNGRHPDTFLSASADWTVKLWNSNRSRALMSFDIGCPVEDAAWAPYSATVFAAAGEDGRLQVYDLAHNKAEPVSKQKIVGKAALTRIAFNLHHPVILVGDDTGCVHCLKLSPNLRRVASTAGKSDFNAARLDAIIDVALKSDVPEESAL